MKVYISGAISGRPFEETRERFARAEEAIRLAGHEPISPFDNGLTSEHTWAEHMMEDLKMLQHADVIYLLEGFSVSDGAMTEFYFSYGLGIGRIYADEIMETGLSEVEFIRQEINAIVSRRTNSLVRE